MKKALKVMLSLMVSFSLWIPQEEWHEKDSPGDDDVAIKKNLNYNGEGKSQSLKRCLLNKKSGKGNDRSLTTYSLYKVLE